MDRRLEVQSLLVNLLDDSDRVYFQPPQNVQMTYPCFVYERDGIVPRHAGNKPYNLNTRFSVTFISRDPDDEIPDKLAALPKCRHTRYFRVDNLHHHVFTLY